MIPVVDSKCFVKIGTLVAMAVLANITIFDKILYDMKTKKMSKLITLLNSQTVPKNPVLVRDR